MSSGYYSKNRGGKEGLGFFFCAEKMLVYYILEKKQITLNLIIADSVCYKGNNSFLCHSHHLSYMKNQYKNMSHYSLKGKY